MQMNLLLNENSIDYERITKFSELISDETNDELWSNRHKTVLTPNSEHTKVLTSLQKVFQSYLKKDI